MPKDQMRLSEGVEWAIHACCLLAPLGPERGLSLAALADYHGVPAPYMAKQMQALSRAGIVRTSRGQTGGYALARAADTITLLDVVHAVDGAEPAFRCGEIRQRGPCAVPPGACRAACPIAAAFAAAQRAWRTSLAAVSIGALVAQVGRQGDPAHVAAVIGWYRGEARTLPASV